MESVTTNGMNLYAQLAHRMRASLGEFDDPDRDLEGLVRELAEFKRSHLTQPAQAVDVEKGRFALNDRVQFNNGTHVFGGYVHRIEYPHTIYYVQLDDGCEYACYGDDPKVTLTAALPNANGKKVK